MSIKIKFNVATLFVSLVACAACGATAATANEKKLASLLPTVLEKSEAHYRALEAAAQKVRFDKNGKALTPHSWRAADGTLDMRPLQWWTSGHFPGALWYLYEATGKEEWKKRALDWTNTQEAIVDYFGNHDVGFRTFCSIGNGMRLSPADRQRYEGWLVRSAHALCNRYHEGLGLIRSWGKVDDNKNFVVIPDNMMNLELLMWASKQPVKDAPRFRKIARSHADISMKNHFRVDGGTYHVLNYDQKTGHVLEISRGQGANCVTAWSRGQSWAIYGYTVMYRETGDKKYLDFARKLADYAINHPNMPDDGVPYWDFGAPGEERDSSAGSIMASALLELSTFVPGKEGTAYRAFAVKQLLSLASDAYYAKQSENGGFLLKHGVGHKPANSEIDVPLNYGDYYFLEALLRYKNLK